MLLLVEHEWPDCQSQSQSEGSACKCEYGQSCCGRLILGSDTFETHVRSAAQGLSTEKGLGDQMKSCVAWALKTRSEQKPS